MATKESSRAPKGKKSVLVAKSPVDLQRMKLEKLMEHPDKPVPIPEPPKERVLPPPPEFNRNVMGSSAGAGSGEFHVYRHIRRREYARQKYIAEKAEKEVKDDDYHRRLEENRQQAEEKTAKKRAKRLKKKMNAKKKKGKQATDVSKASNQSKDESDSEEQKTDQAEDSPN